MAPGGFTLIWVLVKGFNFKRFASPASARPHTHVPNWLEVLVKGKHPELASLPREKLPC